MSNHIEAGLDYFLRNVLRTHEVAHSGRTLYDHLAGTFDLLHRWQMVQPVQLCGLFHSVYGTNAFQGAVLDRTKDAERHLLASLIGERAEHLVYLFGTIARPGILLQPSDDSKLDRWDRIDLLQVEVANLLEQGCPEPMLQRLEACPALLSKPRKAVRWALRRALKAAA